MKSTTTKMCLALCMVAFLFNDLRAQHDFGMAGSNYAGIHSITFNPGEIADSRYAADINLFSFDFNFDNDYFDLKSNGFLRSGVFLGDYTDYDDFRETNLIDGFDAGKTDPANLYLNLDMMGPSALITISPKDAIALSSRFRFGVNIDDIGYELAKLSVEEYEFAPLWGQDFESDGGSIDIMNWAEYGVGYGRVIMDNEEHFLKGGLHFKYLSGLSSAYFYGNDINYNFKNDDTLTVVSSAFEYGHTDNFEFSRDILNFESFGSGFGFDLGFVYEYRPEEERSQMETIDGKTYSDRTQSQYKFKVGLSLLDVGGIKFDKDVQSFDRDQAAVNEWDLTVVEFDLVADWDDTLEVRFPDVGANNRATYRMNLPMTIGLQFDYHIQKDFYIAASAYYSRSHPGNSNKLFSKSQVMIAPRWERKWLTAALPLSVDRFAGFDAGLMLRIGPLFIASENLWTNIFSEEINGTHAALGLKVPIPHSKSIIAIE